MPVHTKYKLKAHVFRHTLHNDICVGQASFCIILLSLHIFWRYAWLWLHG